MENTTSDSPENRPAIIAGMSREGLEAYALALWAEVDAGLDCERALEAALAEAVSRHEPVFDPVMEVVGTEADGGYFLRASGKREPIKETLERNTPKRPMPDSV